MRTVSCAKILVEVAMETQTQAPSSKSTSLPLPTPVTPEYVELDTPWSPVAANVKVIKLEELVKSFQAGEK
jgi:hypothetical protein